MQKRFAILAFLLAVLMVTVCMSGCVEQNPLGNITDGDGEIDTDEAILGLMFWHMFFGGGSTTNNYYDRNKQSVSSPPPTSSTVKSAPAAPAPAGQSSSIKSSGSSTSKSSGSSSSYRSSSSSSYRSSGSVGRGR